MNRGEFLQGDVAAFVTWLCERLPTLEVRLRFARSKFVPNGIDAVATGIEQVLGHYCWSVSWTDRRSGSRVVSDDWASTRSSLSRLSVWLRESVASGDDAAAGQAAREVLRWGRVRGAIPFIDAKVRDGALCVYLLGLAPLLSLEGDQHLDALNANNVHRFDAGMTKIHALLDTTGSPIYDSRVGAALAMLYEMFRQETVRDGVKHGPLSFPSGRARGRQIRDPGDLGLAAAPQFYKPQVPRYEWARCQLRAGWIIREVLRQTTLFESESADGGTADMAARCHAFEASLFMIGYDLRSLAGGAETPVAANAKRAGRRARQSGNWVPSGHPFSSVLAAYLEYRQTSPADIGRNGLRQWLQQPAQAIRFASFNKSFPSYCYPFREPELNLFDRALKELELIAEGGESGLIAANYGEPQFIAGDEREQVCLVCAGLAGYCGLLESSERANRRLVRKELAGTAKSAATLLSVGRDVGRHFGLLDSKNLPTDWFYRFFADGFDYFRDRLGVDGAGYDTDPR
ncbi:hypothetical protein [Paraburkholderia nemoris]|uniref:hypothetical protein n=1 Tax=Paraburkholderia nemoris TaxID=2793076 RepID=UPI001B18B2C9|nr:hypothetical protein [Paraburkholderia nemoris]CAE6773697.1 hypothetical protein R75777_04020 [Paraburkholderia nemoris]